MPRRALLVVNPASRRGGRLADTARQAIEAQGVACDVVLTERGGHAGELAAALAPRADVVFTLGGDGTLMEVVSALAGGGMPIGLLAGGTGNQVVRALGIPLDVRRAVPALLRGTERTIDLGRLGRGHHFALSVGIGPDVAMIAETSAAAKRRFGVAAYAWSALRAITRLEQFEARVTVDGVTVEAQVAAVMVANLPGVENGRVTFGPDIRPDDGILNVCLYQWRTLRHAAETFWRAGTGQIGGDPTARFLKGREILVETFPARGAEADGELLGVGPVSATVEPASARLLIPKF